MDRSKGKHNARKILNDLTLLKSKLLGKQPAYVQHQAGSQYPAGSLKHARSQDLASPPLQAHSQQQEQPRGLLKLPPELRNSIYEYFVHGTEDCDAKCGTGEPFVPQRALGTLQPHVVFVPPGWDSSVSFRSPRAPPCKLPGLAGICRQIRGEMLPLLVEQRCFWFDDALTENDKIRWWLDHWSDALAFHVRFLLLSDYRRYDDGERLRHSEWCDPIILIDLHNGYYPATEFLSPRCFRCHEGDSSTARIDAVIRRWERIDGRWRLNKEGMLQILDIAGWLHLDATPS